MRQAPEPRLPRPLHLLATAIVGGLLVVLTAACRSSDSDIEAILKSGLAEAGEVNQEWHRGPRVFVDANGPARFVPALLDAYDADAAMETVRFVDGYYRAPGNEGYDAVIEHLIEKLRAAGFDGGDPRLSMRVIETPMESPSWTPRSASITLHAGETHTVLHNFQNRRDSDRTILPLGAPSCDVTGRVRFSLRDIEPGDILVTSAPLATALKRAQDAGAVAILSAKLEDFNVDPTNLKRHRNAIMYKRLDRPSPLPVAQISQNSLKAIRKASDASPDGVTLTYRANIEYGNQPMRTLEARIVGATRPAECSVSVAHIQEPGASDNASGVGGQLEAAIASAKILRAGLVPWPSRSVAFVWGDEYTQTEIWLADTELTPVAGISSDMMGNSPETGAIALLERTPDPGGVLPLAPDEHTAWGAGRVTGDMVLPNGFSVVARCAMIDVAISTAEKAERGPNVVTWKTADHPWEGGSDHDVFNAAGIPGVLFWHFTDYTYHTSLDRMDVVDGEELRRSEVTLAATLLAMADPRPKDLSRYLISLGMESELRIKAANEAKMPGLAAAWSEWHRGASAWLRSECLGISQQEALLARTEEELAQEAISTAFYKAQSE
jgi:aminopeptidase YwaD